MSLRFRKAAAGRVRTAAGVMAVAFAFDASAQSLPVLNENPEFNLGLDGWLTSISTPGGSGSIAWSPTDLLGKVGSGSVVVSGPRGVYTLYVCFKADRLFDVAREFRTEIVTANTGVSARVISNLKTGFLGDAGETGECVGPATDDVDGVDTWLDVPGVVQHVTPSQFVDHPGPLITFSVTVNKFDDGVVLLDGIRLVADTDILFRQGFE